MSLTSLKSSRSSISRLSGDRGAPGADGLLAEPLVEVAVVVEAGQRVAVGEGPGLFVQAGVLEGDRGLVRHRPGEAQGRSASSAIGDRESSSTSPIDWPFATSGSMTSAR